MSNQDKSKETSGNVFINNSYISKDAQDAFYSSATNASSSTSLLYQSKNLHSPFTYSNQRANASSNSISPLNANSNTSFMTSPIMQSPQLFSPSAMSINTFTGTNIYSSSAVQKSLSALDLKAMTRDISMGGDSLNAEESWPSLVVRVLPLFNGERLNGHIEDLNEVVRACLRNVDVATLTRDIYNDLLAAGMFTINAKLVGVHEDKVASRLVELWSFFLGTVLPYLEGVFLPHQIELLQLKRSNSLNSVRTMALTSFKEQVIVPFMARLEGDKSSVVFLIPHNSLNPSAF
ncbi:hypothetical protein DSO57_1026108 [Entomophthora muscae]|uniref:Uncharacterized protein n=1 Tax=Entomophthora muscae TaxID=34485 RepID=A0ACC2RTA7_9FUNG|nr:hypothetical protein DSO57_1026108 [Entomophthora muscae]